MYLPDKGIFADTKCPFSVHNLVASENAVWALNTFNGNIVARSGLRHCEMGVDWIEHKYFFFKNI